MPSSDPYVASIEDINTAYKILHDLVNTYSTFSQRPPFRFHGDELERKETGKSGNKRSPKSILSSQLKWRRDSASKEHASLLTLSAIRNNVRYSFFRLPVLPVLGSDAEIRGCINTVSKIGTQIAIWFHHAYTELQDCGLKGEEFISLCNEKWGRYQLEWYPWPKLKEAITLEHKLLLHELQMLICDMQSRRLLAGVHRSTDNAEDPFENGWTIEGRIDPSSGDVKRIAKQDLARDLGLTANAINHWMHQGLLTPINPGGKPLLFNLEDAIAAATSQKKDVAKLIRRRNHQLPLPRSCSSPP
ncbi:MAG: hypothetical protein ACK6DC_00240 [Planctomycetota bacterium]|jgi:hypothetical protein